VAPARRTSHRIERVGRGACHQETPWPKIWAKVLPKLRRKRGGAAGAAHALSTPRTRSEPFGSCLRTAWSVGTLASPRQWYVGAPGPVRPIRPASAIGVDQRELSQARRTTQTGCVPDPVFVRDSPATSRVARRKPGRRTRARSPRTTTRQRAWREQSSHTKRTYTECL
jgi:hypothetical protein